MNPDWIWFWWASVVIVHQIHVNQLWTVWVKQAIQAVSSKSCGTVVFYLFLRQQIDDLIKLNKKQISIFPKVSNCSFNHWTCLCLCSPETLDLRSFVTCDWSKLIWGRVTKTPEGIEVEKHWHVVLHTLMTFLKYFHFFYFSDTLILNVQFLSFI